MPHSLRTWLKAGRMAVASIAAAIKSRLAHFSLKLNNIVPESQGGRTVGENLAFACRHCNAYKAAATEAVDPETGQMVRLFHPRGDDWSDHFERSSDRLLILGRTPIGRATVMRLHFNDPSEQRARAIHRDYLATLFPLDD